MSETIVKKPKKETFKTMIEYVCCECQESEFLYGIVPKKKCPHCGKWMEAIEFDE